jgi:arylsulfatase A-like enzyme
MKKNGVPSWFLVAFGLLVLVVVGGLLFLWSNSDRSPSAEFSRTGRESGAVDVLLIIVDTERADYLSPYGSKYPTTPFLQSLANEAILFKNAFAPAPWTVPSMYSIFTGLYPSVHGMMKATAGTKESPHILPETAVTLTEQLRDAGYSTFGINTNYTLQPRFGFSQGFDRFFGKNFAFLPFPNIVLKSLLPEIQKSPKYFTWLHYFDPHQPYQIYHPWFQQWNKSKFTSHTDLALDLALEFYRSKLELDADASFSPEHVERAHRLIMVASGGPILGKVYQMFRNAPHMLDNDYREFLKAGYMSDIRKTDEAMKGAFEMLGVDDQTLVIVTSDHGEELFDHGGLGHHQNSLYQELLHVPLIVRLPHGKGAGKVIDTPVSTIDIYPTLLDLLGLPIPKGLAGVSLKPLVEGGSIPKRKLFAEVNSSSGDSRALIDYPWKYVFDIMNKQSQMFNLESDPTEKNNVVLQYKDKAKELHNQLLEWIESSQLRWPEAQRVEFSEQDIKQLKAMGYMQ